MQELRDACAAVAGRAAHVRVVSSAVAPYAASLSPALAAGADSLVPAAAPGLPALPAHGDREAVAAFWLTMDTINFGSGWFPTLRKPAGRSGYTTISTALGARFDAAGPWSGAELAALRAPGLAAVLDQDPAHALMTLYATALNGLGQRVIDEFAGSFAAVVDAASGSAVSLVERLGAWECFADSSDYGTLRLPFLKRAQIAAADLHRAGVASFPDIGDLTMFADNLVPHVLRLDGVLRFSPSLVARIDREELIEHGSAEEVEIRACGVHAVELIVAAAGRGATAAAVDELLWQRGRQPRYKGSPRHRSRCTAY